MPNLTVRKAARTNLAVRKPARATHKVYGSHGSADLTDGLVHYWPLQELDQDYKDYVGNVDLTPSSSVTQFAMASMGGEIITDKPGSHYVHSTADVAWTSGNSMTVAGWWYFDNNPASQVLFSWRDNTPDRAYLSTFGDGVLHGRIYGDLGNCDLEYTPAEDTLYFIVMTYDSTTNLAKLYVNGKLEDTDTTDIGTIDTTPQALSLGSQSWSKTSGALNGKMGRIGVWSKALSSYDVRRLYNYGRGMKHQDVAGYGSSYLTTKRSTIIKTERPDFQFVGSPSIVEAANGRLIASQVYFGDTYFGSGAWNETVFAYSDDDGETWTYSENAGKYNPLSGLMWGGLHYVNGTLFAAGASNRGNASNNEWVITRSLDNGVTWETPTTIFSGEEFLAASERGVLIGTDYYISYSVDDKSSSSFPLFFAHGVAKWDTTADITDPANWSRTASEVNVLGTDGSFANSNAVESSLYVEDDGTTLKLLCRVNNQAQNSYDRGYLFDVDTSTLALTGSGYMGVPGGHVRFEVHRDPATQYLYSIANTDQPGVTRGGGERTGLQLIRSTDDGATWETAMDLWSDFNGLASGSTAVDLVGFQYASLRPNGRDLDFTLRVSYDDGDNNVPPNEHDTNQITYHRLKDWRRFLYRSLFTSALPASATAAYDFGQINKRTGAVADTIGSNDLVLNGDAGAFTYANGVPTIAGTANTTYWDLTTAVNCPTAFFVIKVPAPAAAQALISHTNGTAAASRVLIPVDDGGTAFGYAISLDGGAGDTGSATVNNHVNTLVTPGSGTGGSADVNVGDQGQLYDQWLILRVDLAAQADNWEHLFHFDDGTTPVYFDGSIAEVVLFSSAPSTADQLTTQLYLAEKWGHLITNPNTSAASVLTYFRSDGISSIFRPDGSSLYIRP